MPGWFLLLSLNIKLEWNRMVETNTLAYYSINYHGFPIQTQKHSHKFFIIKSQEV